MKPKHHQAAARPHYVRTMPDYPGWVGSPGCPWEGILPVRKRIPVSGNRRPIETLEPSTNRDAINFQSNKVRQVRELSSLARISAPRDLDRSLGRLQLLVIGAVFKRTICRTMLRCVRLKTEPTFHQFHVEPHRKSTTSHLKNPNPPKQQTNKRKCPQTVIQPISAQRNPPNCFHQQTQARKLTFELFVVGVNFSKTQKRICSF